MTPTAAQILDHCKAVCVKKDYSRCQVSRVSLRDPEAGYYITRLGWGVSVDANSPRHKIEQAATLLGLDIDRPSPAPVELEWQDDISSETPHRFAIYNQMISASIFPRGGYTLAQIDLQDRITIMTLPKVVVKDHEAQARAWCVEQITKIVTPAPKL